MATTLNLIYVRFICKVELLHSKNHCRKAIQDLVRERKRFVFFTESIC